VKPPHPDNPKPQTVAQHWPAEDPNEPVTGPHEIFPSSTTPDAELVATTTYVKRKLHATEVKAEASLVDAVIAKGRALGALVVATVAVTASVLFGLDARSQNKTDKLEARIEKVEAVQQTAALEQVRVVTMLENLSRERGLPVPPPVPPAPADGGVR